MIESNGSNIKTSPVVRDGKMYITHSIGNSINSDYASIKYVIYNLASNSITEQAELGALGYYYIFPTLTVDKDHNIAVTFSRSADNEYIGGYFSTKYSSDPPGLSSSQILTEGQGNYVVTLGGPRNKWGDYLGIFLDPNEYDIWIFPEYAAATNTWGTYIGQIRMTPYSGPHVFANPLEKDFGFVEVGKTSDTLFAIIANYGDADLIITDLPSSIRDFNCLTSLSFPYTLLSYDSLALEFNFTPIDTGVSKVIYSITTKDPNFAGFSFSGYGVLVVSVNPASFTTSFNLEQNYPNPFNPTTTIKYQIPELSFVTIKVYDLLGNKIAPLVREEKPAGIYEVEFDGTGFPSGIYFYKL